jgi:hypothetical protein
MSETDPSPEGSEPFDIAEFMGWDATTSNGSGEPVFDDITIEDIPSDEKPMKDESFFEDATATIGDGSCIVCGAPTFRPPGLTRAGHKKRVPKYCDLHSPNVRISSQRPSSPGMESQLQRIQEELADDIRLLATMAGPLLPVTGYYLFDHADPFTTAILKLAKNNTRVLRVLHRAAQVAPIYTVAETVAGTAYAVQVDVKKADPYNVIGKRLGVARAYDAIYATDESTNGNGSNPTVSPPPRYSTIP